ncbi:MAG TPA: SRPBCC domain-containing protein [Streptosporangiaceae bacterium]
MAAVPRGGIATAISDVGLFGAARAAAPHGTDYELDFRVGGHERFGGLTPAGDSYRGDAVYYDIVPGRRIVYCYEMYEAGARMPVSLVTVEIGPDGDGSTITCTEQGAFLDGIEKPEAREEGVADMLDKLGAYLAAPRAGS